jgi:hypothetical protein
VAFSQNLINIIKKHPPFKNITIKIRVIKLFVNLLSSIHTTYLNVSHHIFQYFSSIANIFCYMSDMCGGKKDQVIDKAY